MGFKLEGLEEFMERLEAIESRVPDELREFKLDVSNDILEDVIENTPVNKDPKAITAGDLRRGWKVRENSLTESEIYNDTKAKDGEYYGWDVEYGHRTRAGMGLKRSTKRRKKAYKKGLVTFVPGVFMLRGALKVGKASINEKGKKTLDKILGE